jgi:hypothetical protein
LGLLILGAAFFAAIFGAVALGIRASDAYAVALSTASHDSAVVAELGAPIEAGWFVSGSINVSGSSGHADLAIPVSGSVRSGKLYAIATKAAGKWAFSALNVVVDGRPAPIDLLHDLPAP